MIMKIENMKKLIFMLLVCMCVGQACQGQNIEKLNAEGSKFYQAGKYKKALAIFEKAKTQTEKEFGEKSKEYATVLNNIGLCYNEQGLYAKAESLYIEAKNIQEKTLGKENSD